MSAHTRLLPLEDQTFNALLKAAGALAQQAEQLVKANNLTATQYNVLRVLRAEPDGLACSAICERMISHDPDMTRLLDRMEKRSLIVRERQKNDRRVVKARITPEGLALLKNLDPPIRALHKSQFRHIPATQLRALNETLGLLLSSGKQDTHPRFHPNALV